jgi:periplasmic divalent cation tolerance protein
MIERQNDTEQDVVLVITTVADADKARHIGTQMVELQLVACINILSGVESIYQWNGDLEVEGECLCLLKTTNSRLEELEAWIQEHHPYDEPEFLVLPVSAGSSGYLGWVRNHIS